MTTDELEKQIREKQFSRFYYFTGECLYLKRYYIEQMEKAMISQDCILTDVIKLEGKELTPDQFYDMVTAVGLGSEKKMLIIRDIPLSAEVLTVLEEDPDIVSEEVCVVFLSEHEKYDTRLKTFKAFETFLKKNGEQISVEQPSAAILTKWVTQNLRKAGKRISDDDLRYFLDNVDNEMYSLKNEIEKLANYAKNDRIDRKDIDAVCTMTLESSSFKITDAILSHDADTAYKIMNDLFALNTDQNMILGVLYRSVGNLCKIKMLSDAGVSFSEISSLTGIKDFVVRRDAVRLKTFSLNALEKLLERCIDADCESKGFAIDGKETVTKLVACCLNSL